MKALLLPVIYLLGLLPLTLRRSVGRLGGKVYGWFPSRERRIAELQLDCCLPDLGGSRLAPEVFRHLGEVAAECLNLHPLLNQDNIELNIGWEELHREAAHGRGIIALSAHIGNWELLAALCAQAGFSVSAVGREVKQAELHSILERLRERCGVRTIWRQRASGIREIVRTLRDAGIIAALIDQDTQVTSEFSEFFGRPAKTPTALIHLGLRERALFFAAFIARRPDGKQELSFHRLVGTSPSEILSQYHHHLEALIRRFPTQWVWQHKRWRTAPGVSPRSSAEYIAALEEENAASNSRR